jgi:hypothetical protein
VGEAPKIMMASKKQPQHETTTHSQRLARYRVWVAQVCTATTAHHSSTYARQAHETRLLHVQHGLPYNSLLESASGEKLQLFIKIDFGGKLHIGRNGMTTGIRTCHSCYQNRYIS